MGGTIAKTPSGTVAATTGTGAVGAANLSMIRMAVLLDQIHRGLKIIEDAAKELAVETTVTGEMAELLVGSFGERASLRQLQLLAGMLVRSVEGSTVLVVRSADGVKAALVANLQVQQAQKQLHDLGADGGYVDSQRRAG